MNSETFEGCVTVYLPRLRKVVNPLKNLLDEVGVGDVDNIIRWCNLHKSFAETLVYGIFRTELPTEDIQPSILTEIAREEGQVWDDNVFGQLPQGTGWIDQAGNEGQTCLPSDDVISA